MTKTDAVYGALLIAFVVVFAWMLTDIRERFIIGMAMQAVVLIARVFWKRQRRST